MKLEENKRTKKIESEMNRLILNPIKLSTYKVKNHK